MKIKTKSGKPAYREVNPTELYNSFLEMTTTIRHNACFIQVRHHDNDNTQRNIESIIEALNKFIKVLKDEN